MELHEEVTKILNPKIIQKAKTLIKVKLLFYAFIYILFFISIFSPAVYTNQYTLIIAYCFFGLSGILFAFNASHDATHEVLFDKKIFNVILHYMVFNLQGVNATLWKKRHIRSHHLFPNVDGCDADIDDNPFIRLSKQHKLKKMHKFQHLYAPFIYCLYTLHWILIKDFVYLKKTRVANMTDLTYTTSFKIEVILLKLGYFFLLIGLPYLFTEASLGQILIAFFCMHFFISIFFVLTLIISHLTMETVFPIANENGTLPFDYHQHQLAVSMDYHPKSKVANWIFGGFNAHSAHHLFPNMQHTLYAEISPSIKKIALKHGLAYNELPIHKAILSHFRFLKKLGT